MDAEGVGIAVAVIAVVVLRSASFAGRANRRAARSERAAEQRSREAWEVTQRLRQARNPQDAITPEQQADRAAVIVIERQEASPALLQREMGVGVLTAVRILGQLRTRGIVGPGAPGTGACEVLVGRPGVEDARP